MDKLEQRIIELGRKMEKLRGENDSFRLAAMAGKQAQASNQEARAELESLKRENHSLRQRLEEVDKRLGTVLEEIDKMSAGGKA